MLDVLCQCCLYPKIYPTGHYNELLNMLMLIYVEKVWREYILTSCIVYGEPSMCIRRSSIESNSSSVTSWPCNINLVWSLHTRMNTLPTTSQCLLLVILVQVYYYLQVSSRLDYAAIKCYNITGVHHGQMTNYGNIWHCGFFSNNHLMHLISILK